jgi:hypothetical protein
LIAVVWPPWGKPIVVLAFTVDPASSSAHRFSANGMMQTLATS